METAPRPPTEQLSCPHFCGDARANSHDDPSDSSHCGTAVVGDPCPSDQSHDVMLPIAEDKGSEDESSDSSITESNECSDFCSCKFQILPKFVLVYGQSLTTTIYFTLYG